MLMMRDATDASSLVTLPAQLHIYVHLLVNTTIKTRYPVLQGMVTTSYFKVLRELHYSSWSTSYPDKSDHDCRRLHYYRSSGLFARTTIDYIQS